MLVVELEKRLLKNLHRRLESCSSARRKEILDEMSSNENIFSYPLDVTNQDQMKILLKKLLKILMD